MIAREKWQVRTIAVLENVFKERLRQVAKHGHNDDLEFGSGPETRWLGFYTQDPARVIQQEIRISYEEYEDETGRPTFVHVLLEEVAEAFECDDLDRLETELTEVAAVAVNWIEHIRKQRES